MAVGLVRPTVPRPGGEPLPAIAQRTLGDAKGGRGLPPRQAAGLNYLVDHHHLLLTQYGHARLRLPKGSRRVRSCAAPGEGRCVNPDDR